MIEAQLVLALTAGMLAAFNPCGFALLIAYVGYFLGLDESRVNGGADMSGGPVDLVTGWSANISDWVQNRGALAIAAVMMTLIGISFVVAFTARRRARSDSRDDRRVPV